MKRTTVRLIVFDLDGTLVDTAPDIANAANVTLKRFGYPERGLKEVKDAIGRGVHELITNLIDPNVIESEVLEEAADFFKNEYRANLVCETKPFEGVCEALRGPLAKYQKAVVTNKPDDLTRLILKELHMEGYFEKVLGLGLGFPAKPDPSGVRHVMDALRVSPEETFFVGDSSVDCQTAARAGVSFVWVDYGYEDLADRPNLYGVSHASDWIKPIRAFEY